MQTLGLGFERHVGRSCPRLDEVRRNILLLLRLSNVLLQHVRQGSKSLHEDPDARIVDSPCPLILRESFGTFTYHNSSGYRWYPVAGSPLPVLAGVLRPRE